MTLARTRPIDYTNDGIAEIERRVRRLEQGLTVARRGAAGTAPAGVDRFLGEYATEAARPTPSELLRGYYLLLREAGKTSKYQICQPNSDVSGGAWEWRTFSASPI